MSLLRDESGGTIDSKYDQYPNNRESMEVDADGGHDHEQSSKSPVVKRISRACIRCRQRKSKCNL